VATIDHPDDPRVADFRHLNDASFRRRLETAPPFAQGFFVAEGWLVLERAVATRHHLRAVLVIDAKLDRLRDIVDVDATAVLAAPAEIVAEVVGFDLHRGVVASVERRRLPDPASVAARSRRLLVVESVNDGENLGVLFRNAAGLGADGLLLDTTTCDPYARRTVRVSMGHALALPWSRAAEPWALGSHRRVALTPHRDAIPLDEVRVAADEPVALLVGAEGPGLSDAALDAVDVLARIPMAREVDSLNVGSAAAIAMWQLFSGSLG
jgi:tRNA G18 (ribose-2'-O)-methylase SpoU